MKSTQNSTSENQREMLAEEFSLHLLAAHQLLDIQRVMQLHQILPLANQKPPKLLAKMLHLCPRSQNNAFFNCLFLNKLSRELCNMLSETDMASHPRESRLINFCGSLSIIQTN
jgi:hypothetical protein